MLTRLAPFLLLIFETVIQFGIDDINAFSDNLRPCLPGLLTTKIKLTEFFRCHFCFHSHLPWILGNRSPSPRTQSITSLYTRTLIIIDIRIKSQVLILRFIIVRRGEISPLLTIIRNLDTIHLFIYGSSIDVFMRSCIF